MQGTSCPCSAPKATRGKSRGHSTQEALPLKAASALTPAALPSRLHTSTHTGPAARSERSPLHGPSPRCFCSSCRAPRSPVTAQSNTRHVPLPPTMPAAELSPGALVFCPSMPTVRENGARSAPLGLRPQHPERRQALCRDCGRNQRLSALVPEHRGVQTQACRVRGPADTTCLFRI